MYGYDDTESASLPTNATINVNGTTVTLSESKPYGEYYDLLILRVLSNGHHVNIYFLSLLILLFVFRYRRMERQ